MKWLALIALLLTSASIAGCATDKASVCAGWEPFQPSRLDDLTEGTAKQIIAHNEYGIKMGCWR